MKSKISTPPSIKYFSIRNNSIIKPRNSTTKQSINEKISALSTLISQKLSTPKTSLFARPYKLNKPNSQTMISNQSLTNLTLNNTAVTNQTLNVTVTPSFTGSSNPEWQGCRRETGLLFNAYGQLVLNYSEQQIVGWMLRSCRHKPLLVEVFLRKEKNSATKDKTLSWQELTKVERKLDVKWMQNGDYRFLKSRQVRWLREWMQSLLLEKNRMRARQICNKLAVQNIDNSRDCSYRQKSVQIQHFLKDLTDNQQKYGFLDGITPFHRSNFAILNKAENTIEASALAAPTTQLISRHNTLIIVNDTFY